MNLRKSFQRFCYRHRDKGIPNLMLYLVLGTAVVYIMNQIDRSNTLYRVLCFDREKILQGQVWRLVTYALTYDTGNILLTAISLVCYYSLGRTIENIWGTLRFNLFYLTGLLIMDIFCLCFPLVSADVYYLNLSLFLAYATLFPHASFLFFFFIPVKAWIFGLLDIGLTLLDVIRLSYPVLLFPYNLFPILALANYFLFFGKDVCNLIPQTWRIRLGRLFKKKPKPAKTGPIPFTQPGDFRRPEARNYTHRCTVCGRTDVSNPELEFRYCSRCRGYYCYCQAHIDTHSHIE